MKITRDLNNTKSLKKKRYGVTHWTLSSMLIPGILLVFVFSYLPMFGIFIAFKDYKFSKGILESNWNGIDNFKFLFKSDTLYSVLRNTICYNLTFIFLGIVVGVFFAMLLERVSNRRAIKFFQSSMFIPYFLSWVVISYISFSLLEYNTGIINNLRVFGGLGRLSFYSEPKYWPFILTGFNLWKGVGFNALIYYGCILSIDSSLYEAATIDGCGYYKKFWNITLPHLRQTIIILTLMSLGGIFRSDFGLFLFIPMDTGALYQVTDVLDSFINRTLRTSTNIGMSSAMGFLQSIVGFIFVVTANGIVNKIESESALF